MKGAKNRGMSMANFEPDRKATKKERMYIGEGLGKRDPCVMNIVRAEKNTKSEGCPKTPRGLV